MAFTASKTPATPTTGIPARRATSLPLASSIRRNHTGARRHSAMASASPASRSAKNSATRASSARGRYAQPTSVECSSDHVRSRSPGVSGEFPMNGRRHDASITQAPAEGTRRRGVGAVCPLLHKPGALSQRYLQLVFKFARRIVHGDHPSLVEQRDKVLDSHARDLGCLGHGELPPFEQVQCQCSVHAELEEAIAEGNGKNRGSTVFRDQRQAAFLGIPQEIPRTLPEVPRAE